jgi:hypothetical protein
MLPRRALTPISERASLVQRLRSDPRCWSEEVEPAPVIQMQGQHKEALIASDWRALKRSCGASARSGSGSCGRPGSTARDRGEARRDRPWILASGARLRPMADDNAVDPVGHGSTVWMQELDEAKALRHAMHLDVSVAREHVAARLQSALAAAAASSTRPMPHRTGRSPTARATASVSAPGRTGPASNRLPVPRLPHPLGFVVGGSRS